MSMLAVTLVQPRLIWEDPAANVAHLEQLFAEINDTDLIVLPEMFSTGFSMRSHQLAETMEGPTVAWLRERAQRHGASVCGSVIIEEGGHYFNRFLLAGPDGSLVSYDKRHLFRMSEENEHYSPGEQRVTMRVGEFILLPQICYDLRFPVYSRNQVREGNSYDLIVYVANWPQARRDHWRALLRERAFENQCYVVGVNRIGRDGNGINYSGDSMAFDFGGDVLTDMEGREDTFTVQLDREALGAYRDAFPVWRDADPFDLRRG